ncbi:sigma-70 family RNA polymerase sigma factor [Actinoplanes sp. NEAU-A12]|uniref:Sigma-70 family RNA polymerase sigma factor n=1 Tax=Actinoplanes sandaracinus TaxID=3045177 RepID=A0ABT6X0B5_9ACTN|nr:sigma-70 family RNA polymerase sigma factor [Actinoplanes sandaracinus]MDI6105451.1 sigma-70 family RNA polymerase sigma factor [Actinoplanes sandaracinus]
MGHPSDRMLVLSAQSGDESAREAILRRYLPLVYNIVGRALSGQPDVDDVVQECMLRIFRDLPDLREPDRLRAWVGAVVMARIGAYRRESRDATVSLAEAPEPVTDFESETILRLDLSGQRREVAEAARWLDPGERPVLSLWWLEAAGELSRAEVAEALGITPAYAAVRIQRMRAQLDTSRSVVTALAAGDCPGLRAVVRGWDGQPAPVWRKRIARHVRDCPLCDHGVDSRISPEKLLLGCALVPVPAGLTGAATGAISVSGHTRSGTAKTVAASVTAAAVVAVAVIAYANMPDQPREPAAQTVAAPTGEAPTAASPSRPVPAAITPVASSPTPSRTPARPSPTPPATASRDWANWPMPNPGKAGLPHRASYTDLGDGTVRDNVTRLVWQRTVTEELPYREAKTYCASLKLAGGGWHLPTRIELTSIIDHSRRQPAIDVRAFPGTSPRFFWSSTPWAVDESRLAWAFNFYEGLTSNAGVQTNAYWARCVRSEGGSGDPAYRTADGQVTDPATSLTWERTGPAAAMSAAAATSYCAGLTLGGQTGWRLPSVKEIATTVDDSRVHPAINVRAFPGTVGNGWYWTSTNAAPEPGRRWALNYDDGFTDYRRATTGFVRCVR